MKLTRIWIGPALAGLVLLGGCSSSPTRTTTNVEAQDRAGYIKTVDRKLDSWEKEATSMDNQERGRDMLANVRDARAELRNMEGAPSSEWEDYKGRVDTRLNHIQKLEKGTAE